MPDFSPLLERCDYVNKISSKLIDEFLIYYAATNDKADREFDTRIARFKDVVKEMPSSWKGLIKAQYIAHRIFKERGLIHKYLKSTAIKARDEREQAFLREMAAHPWRFCFSVIRKNLAPDLYEMEDLISGKIYQLYSPAVGRTLAETPVLLWFTLIGYNDLCYQTYGPVIPFRGFDINDIVFYATEWNDDAYSDDVLAAEVDENPVRYMALAVGSNYPLVLQQEHEVVQVAGETNVSDVDTQALRKSFSVEYAEPVYKLSHKEWSEPPHFAETYYDEEAGTLLLFALTDKGYQETAALLHAHGIEVPEDPDIRLHPSMTLIIEKVFRRKLDLNPYSRLFERKTSPEAAADMADLNLLLALALPYINAGEQPDVAALAKEAGVDPAVAEDLLQKTMDRMKELRKKR